MIPSTQSNEENTNISLQLEVDEVAESVDDDSSNDSYSDPASEEEDDIKQEPEFMDSTPQNGDSTYQKGDNLFPLSTSEWTDSGGDHLSQAIPVIKQEPTDNGEYENSVTQSVETTHTKTVYHCTQLTSSDTTSHPIMSDTNVGVVKQEPTDKGEYENSVMQSVETSERIVSHHHTPLVLSGAPASLSVMSSNIVTSSGAPASLSGMSSNIVTSSGAPASLSGMSSNIVTSSGAPALQSGSGPQSVFSIIPSVGVAQIPCSTVQNPAVIGAPTLLPVIPAIAQTINCATSGNVVPPQVLNVIRRGNSLILESASALPSTVKPNIQNPLFTFAHPVELNLQSDSNLPPTLPVAANVSNVDQGGSKALQSVLVPEDEGSKQMDKKMFNRNKKFEAHMRTQTVGDQAFKSDVYWTTFRWKRKYIEKPCRCDVCGKALKNAGNLKTHMRTHTVKEPYRCDVCGKAFNQTGHLKTHMRIHTGDKPYKCVVCGKAFNRKENLSKHMRTHTGAKPYKCEVCRKAFRYKESLNRHIRMHTVNEPYKCEVCGKAFFEKGVLQGHIRIHTGDQPNKCEVCGKAFIQKGNLKTHMRIHTGEKPYKCDVCGKAFSEKGTLQKHMITHTGERPYKCVVCGKTFNRKGILKRHMRIHTRDKPYKCDVCGKAFNRKGIFQAHMRTHTSEAKQNNMYVSGVPTLPNFEMLIS